MGVSSWMFVGLIAGALAKLIMPGKDPRGFFLTISIGVAGALIGGFIGSQLGVVSVSGFDFRSLLPAIGGSVVLLFADSGWKYLATNLWNDPPEDSEGEELDDTIWW